MRPFIISQWRFRATSLMGKERYGGRERIEPVNELLRISIRRLIYDNVRSKDARILDIRHTFILSRMLDERLYNSRTGALTRLNWRCLNRRSLHATSSAGRDRFLRVTSHNAGCACEGSINPGWLVFTQETCFYEKRYRIESGWNYYFDK